MTRDEQPADAERRPSSKSRPQGFERVTLDPDGGGSWARRAQLIAAAAALVTLLAVAAHAVRGNLEVLEVADTDVPVMDLLYWLSLLFVAVVAGPALASRPERVLGVARGLRERPAVAVASGYALLLFGAGTVYPYVAPEPIVDPVYSLQPPVWGDVPEPYVPRCLGPVVGGRCQGTLEHVLGTDGGGTDMLRVGLYGLNTSLQVAVTASVIAVAAGIGVGTTAGYVGGRTDELLMRYVDVQRALPAFFVYVLAIVVFRRGYPLMVLAFGLLSWGGIARQVRGEVRRRREESFVEAAELSGASNVAVVTRHVLPNAAPVIVAATAVLFGKFVVYEASLSFLTLTDPVIHSLGNEIASSVGRESGDVVMAASSPRYDWALTPWIVAVPGGILCSLLLAVGLLGDGLIDVLDPRSA